MFVREKLPLFHRPLNSIEHVKEKAASPSASHSNSTSLWPHSALFHQLAERGLQFIVQASQLSSKCHQDNTAARLPRNFLFPFARGSKPLVIFCPIHCEPFVYRLVFVIVVAGAGAAAAVVVQLESTPPLSITFPAGLFVCKY